MKKLNARRIAMCFVLTATASWAAGSALLVETQLQAVRGDTHSSKFEEYETVPRGFFVDRLGVDMSTSAYRLRFEGVKPGLLDQSFQLEGGVWGMQDWSLGYNQIPHDLSNTAQTYLTNMGNGVYTLPDKMQSDLQTSTANSSGFLNNVPFVPLRVDRRRTNFSYAYNPTGRWRMNLGYQNEKKDGSKAIGVAYGHGQLEESLEPIDYQTHDVHFETEYVGEKAGFSAGYRFSTFEDGIPSLTVDNPYQLANGAVSAAGASTPGTARLALPPDNSSHQGALTFNAKPTAKSSLSADLSYAVQQQNAAFQSLTSNALLLNDARLPAFPTDSLHGERDTIASSVKWNWKPVDNASLNVRGRYYDLGNRTQSINVAQYVPYDSSISTGTPGGSSPNYNPTRNRRSLPINYQKISAGADLYYSFSKALSMKMAYEREKMQRYHRESESNMEDTYFASFKVGPVASVTLRPSYEFKRRMVKGYDAERVAEETYPVGEGTSLGNLPDLRKYDQAGRRRTKTILRAEWEPVDAVSAGMDLGRIREDFDADYGTLNSDSVNYSVDFAVRPTEQSRLFADYTWEETLTNTRARYRSTAANDIAANDWIGRLQDTVHTLNVGASVDMMQERLSLMTDYSMSYARGIQTSESLNPIAVPAAGLAADMPRTYTRYNRLRANARYKLTKSLAARLGYEYRKYSETDWSQDTLDVYQIVWNKSVFLGASQASYEAHIMSAGLAYNF